MSKIPDYLVSDPDVRWILESTRECWDSDLTPCPIPAGADPVWQPHSYLHGCSGWVATTGYLFGPNPETPWLVALHDDPCRRFRERLASDVLLGQLI